MSDRIKINNNHNKKKEQLFPRLPNASPHHKGFILFVFLFVCFHRLPFTFYTSDVLIVSRKNTVPMFKA